MFFLLNSVLSPKKPALQALFLLFVFSGVIHLTGTFLYTIISRDTSKLNFFRLIELELLIPSVIRIPYNATVSIGVMIMLYVLLLWYAIRNK